MSILVVTRTTQSTGKNYERNLKVDISVGDVTLGDIGRHLWPHIFTVVTCSSVQIYDKDLDTYVDALNPDELIVAPKNRIRIDFVESNAISVIRPPASYAVCGTSAGTALVIGQSTCLSNDGTTPAASSAVARIKRTPVSAVKYVPVLPMESSPVAASSPAWNPSSGGFCDHNSEINNSEQSHGWSASPVNAPVKPEILESSEMEEKTDFPRNSVEPAPKRKKKPRSRSFYTVIESSGSFERSESASEAGSCLDQNQDAEESSALLNRDSLINLASVHVARNVGDVLPQQSGARYRRLLYLQRLDLFKRFLDEHHIPACALTTDLCREIYVSMFQNLGFDFVPLSLLGMLNLDDLTMNLIIKLNRSYSSGEIMFNNNPNGKKIGFTDGGNPVIDSDIFFQSVLKAVFNDPAATRSILANDKKLNMSEIYKQLKAVTLTVESAWNRYVGQLEFTPEVQSELAKFQSRYRLTDERLAKLFNSKNMRDFNRRARLSISDVMKALGEGIKRV